MIAIATLIIVLTLSLIIVRIGAEALVLTGLSREAASFQARSAWTGTGFTTAEAESVVNHPVRRRIVGWIMLARGAGLVTTASSLMLSFVNVADREEGFLRFAVLVGGLVALLLFARSEVVERWMSAFIARMLKRYTDLDTHDYAGLLHLAGEYAIMETRVDEHSWMAHRRLGALGLRQEGVVTLGVTRPDGAYIGAPLADTHLGPGDTLVVYGRSSTLAELSRRRHDRAADAGHEAAVAEQQEVLAEEEPLR